MGHSTMENRNGLIVDCLLTHAAGCAEREAALHMLGGLPYAKTLGADKGYDTADFVAGLRQRIEKASAGLRR